ncbi:MAG: hypothetical protein SFY67_01815 [Candidatus Melainabacteria bacterium]|nr:hypothetical protein [Candidatus Melainabacteria bacterium]
MNSSTKTRERLIKSFILKCAVIQFTVAIVSIAAFSTQFCETIEDDRIGFALLCSAIWSVVGTAFYPYIRGTNRIVPDAQKILILVIFFAPTLSILTFGPMLKGEGFAFLPKVSELFSDLPQLKTTEHMFFARFPIARGESLTAKTIVFLAVDPTKHVGGIIATKDNHFGDSKNKESMLLRKCIYPIEAGSPIRDSDIEPHYQ